jgi:hypothetical protein
LTEAVSLLENKIQKLIKQDYGIKGKPITVRNPQANVIVERAHQVIGNIIRTFELEDNYLDEEDPWEDILTATSFAVCPTFHTTLHQSPGQLVFGRDMIFNILNMKLTGNTFARGKNGSTRINKERMQSTSLMSITLEIKSSLKEELKTNMKHPTRAPSIS